MSKDQEMSFLQHLEELRWHLVRSAIGVLVATIAVFVNKTFIFDVVIFGPKNSDFPTFKALCKLSDWLYIQFPSLMESKDILCIGQETYELQNIAMSGQFMTHILVSVVGGLIIAFPYVFWEIWRFIRPALQSAEKNYSRSVVFFTSLLFITGVIFGYYIIVPLSVNFFITYNVSEQVVNLPTLSTYISTVTTIVLACGIVFELPIMIYFLTKVGLVTPELLKKFRKHALIGALILSAIITPPDVFSQLLVSVPILFLYEVSIFISRIIVKKQG